MENVKEHERNAKKKKTGRPQKACKRNKMFMVRLTTEEHESISNKAKEAGMTPSEWFRQSAHKLTITPRLSLQEMAWLRSISGMANNLNQLTRLAYSAGLPALNDLCQQLIEQIDFLMKKVCHDR